MSVPCILARDQGTTSTKALLVDASGAVGRTGGLRKFAPNKGALEWRWINVLITCRFTAERLAREGVESLPDDLSMSDDASH